MSGLITTTPEAQPRQWGAASAAGAHSFVAARMARIVLQREPLATEALSWTTLYSCQADPVRGRAELALYLLGRPELQMLEPQLRLARAYDAVFDRYDQAPPPDLAYWCGLLGNGQSVEDIVRNELVPRCESGYRAGACAAPAGAGRPLFAVRDGAGLPLVFSVGANQRLYMFRRTPFGRWSQTELSSMLPMECPCRVEAVDVRQAPDGTIALALAMERSDGLSSIHVALGVSNALDEAGWVELFRNMAAREPAFHGPVQRIAFGLLQQGATPLVLVSGSETCYFNAASQGGLVRMQLTAAEQPPYGFAIGSYRAPGSWVLRDTPAGRALHFESFAAQYCWTLHIDYQGLPKQANSLLLAPSLVPNVPDVFVAGQGIVVYRGGQSVPQSVVNVRGARLAWAASTERCEFLAYNDAAGSLWLVSRQAGGPWGWPMQVAHSLVMATLLAAPSGDSVHAIGITPGGALAWLRLNAQGAQVGAEEITQSAVWEDDEQLAPAMAA